VGLYRAGKNKRAAQRKSFSASRITHGNRMGVGTAEKRGFSLVRSARARQEPQGSSSFWEDAGKVTGRRCRKRNTQNAPETRTTEKDHGRDLGKKNGKTIQTGVHRNRSWTREYVDKPRRGSVMKKMKGSAPKHPSLRKSALIHKKKKKKEEKLRLTGSTSRRTPCESENQNSTSWTPKNQ